MTEFLAVDLEEARLAGRLLGGGMMDPAVMAELASTGLSEADFRVERMRLVWRVCLAEYRGSGRSEPTLVVDSLAPLLGGDEALAKATVEFCLRSPVHRKQELPALVEHLRRRVATRRITELLVEQHRASRAEGADPLAIAGRLTARLRSITEKASSLVSASGVELGDIGHRRLAEGVPLLPRYPLGLPAIDEMLGGGAAIGRCTVVMADSGVGKSTYAAHMVLAALDAGRRILWFSFEADRGEISEALTEMRAGRRYPGVRDPLSRSASASLAEASAWLAEQPIWIDDASGLRVEEITARARSHQAAHGIDLVIVDYVQSTRTAEGSRGDMAFIQVSEALRASAKDDGLGMLLLSQIAEKKAGEKLAHTAFSKQFERDAAALLLVERDKQAKNAQMRDVSRVTLLKNRFGGHLGEMFMRFDHGTRRLIPCGPTGERVNTIHDVPAWDDE